MYKNYTMYEIKKWFRDPLLVFLLIYPLFLAVILRFGIPYAEKQFNFSLENYYNIIIAFIMLVNSIVTGGIIGFSILDDRDDKILYAIDVSPVSFNYFMTLRFSLSIILTFVTTILSAYIINLAFIPFYALLLVAFSISLFSSVAAMAINCLASNKVEGFAMMKGTGMIIALPIASMFFTDFKEFFFCFEPNFWSVKALSTVIKPEFSFNLEFWSYYIVGFIYVIVLNFLIFKLFKRRIMT